jgi:CHAT domain-containing protein
VDERWIVGRRPAVELGGRTRRRTRPLTALLAGTIRGGPRSVREEIEAIVPRVPETARTMVWDPTTEEVLDALGTRDLVHLSAHGVFRDDNPWFSRVSTGDGALFLADLLDRRTSADLVVLSACASGQVFVGSGDDLSGVAHAFLVSGARRLVASHWRVHDRATRELMEHFYDELAASGFRDPGDALSRARRRTRERWPHPFYWGSFGIHGA